MRHQKLPVSVCSSASATRYRASASSARCAPATSGVLRVDDFERRRFAGLVAQDRQPQALGRQLRDASKVVDARLWPSSASLYIEYRLLTSCRCVWLSVTCAWRSRVSL